MNEQHTSPELRAFDGKLFWRLLLALGVLVTAGAWLTYQTDVNGRIAQAASEQRSRLATHAAAITYRFDDILSDLVVLAQSKHLTTDLDGLGADDLSRLQQDLAVFVAAKNIYDQARYLDVSGMEIVRVDRAGQHNSRVVPSQDLQNKAGRYYFSDTIKLGPGEIYLSPFDLNIERDRIEIPYKPMIRLATPVFTSDGQLSGITVLNYLGQDLLKRLDEAEGSLQPAVQLLNRDGHWLKGPDPEREWGFMFQRSDNFATDHPTVWASIQTAAQGQLEEHGQLWTWQRIELLPSGTHSSTGTARAQGNSDAALPARDYHWIAVSQVSTALDPRQHQGMMIRYGILWLFCLGFVAVASGLIALRQGQLNQKNHQLAQASRELEFLAAHDPLTGALNRRAFLARADIEWARSQRSSSPLAVIACDLDWFKRINDAHGHAMGDEVLKDFCARTQAMLRTADVLARFGGEEFVVMLPDTDLEGARHLAERLRHEIEQQRDARLPAYTVSLGVAASSRGHTATDIHSLISRADEALYRAKVRGRNRVEFNEPVSTAAA